MKTRVVAVTFVVFVLGVMSAGLMAEDPASSPSTDMKAEMASLDAKLDSLVATMNSATGTQKVDAMAAVINELAAQRKAKSMFHCPMHSAQPQDGEQAKHH